jgi:RNA polymerase sigma-70 factor (ECF subfamily)
MENGRFPEKDLKAPRTAADERALVEAAQQDPSRFAELYDDNFERVYAFIARRVRNREETEDLTSEVFHQALANLPRFEWRGVPFAAWLYRIAAYAIADRRRRLGRESGNPVRDEPSKDETEEMERRALLFSLVRELPDEQRRVIEARFIEGRRTREIAAELGRSEGAVKQLQFRALQSLRARMREGHA